MPTPLPPCSAAGAAAMTADSCVSTPAPRQSLDSTKLAPPRPSGRLVARDKLATQLLEARRHRCIVLQGPAGYGKTTTLVAWRQALLPLGFDVAWLTLTTGDNEPTRFLDYLLACLAQVNSAITREATKLVGHGVDREALERTIITLIHGITRHQRDLVLVLDDLQHLTDTRIHEALQWLLDYAPPSLHVALATRSSMPLSLARLRAQQQVLELDLRELRFSAVESERFLQAQLGSIDAREAMRLHEITDGWAAGLQLLALNLKKRREPGAALGAGGSASRVLLQDPQTFAAYFEREVLALLGPTELETLISASACNHFCASLCAALAGRPDATVDLVSVLARLEADNLFIVPVEGADREIWYRLHPLLREILHERLTRRSRARQRALHVAAWQWFQAHGDLSEAVRHAVLAGDVQVAADMVEACARDLAPRGELRKLIGLMRLLPQEQVQASFALRTWTVRLALFARDFGACATGIANLRADLPADDHLGRFELMLLEVAFAVQRDDAETAALMLPELLQPPPAGANAMLLGGRDNLLSWLYIRRGEHERARQLQLETPIRVMNGTPMMGTASGMLQGRCLVGLSYALQGRMTEAERIYRDVLHEAQRGGDSCVEPSYLATALLGEVLYEQGNPVAVVELLENRVDVLERVSIPDSVQRLQYSLAAAHWMLGNRLESFACLERLEDYATHLNLARLLALALWTQAHRRQQLGELDEAQALMHRLEDIERRHPPREPGRFNEIGLMAERSRVRWLLTHRDYEQAAQRLDRLLASMESRNQHRLRPQHLLLRALVEQARGQQEKSRETVLEALRAGHRLGLMRSLLDADPAALGLILETTSNATLDPVLAFYVERLRKSSGSDITDAPTAPTSAEPRAAAVPMDALSDREIDVLQLLAQVMPNKKIARVLGLSPETVKWHLKHIYDKLGVSGRDEAVARVRDMQWDIPGRH